MGSGNERVRINNQHIEELEHIRNQRDIREKELLLKEKIEQFGFEKHKAEIERLANLDRYHFEAEIKKIQAEQRKNDQMHERELKKINNDFLNNQKALANDELSINHKFEVDMLREKNISDNENKRIMADFEIRSGQNRIQHLDILMKRENEAERDRQNYENIRHNNELNFECRMRELNNDRKRNEDINKKELQAINNKFIIDKEKVNNDFLINKNKLDNEKELGIRDINRKEKRDMKKLENEKINLENQSKLMEYQNKKEIETIQGNFKLQELDRKEQHKLNMKQSERQTLALKSEINLNQKKAERELLIEEEKLAEIKKNMEIEIRNKENEKTKIIKEYDMKMKQFDREFEREEKDREIQRENSRYMFQLQYEYQKKFLDLYIQKALNSLNIKDQGNNPESNNFQIPNFFQMFNNMGNMGATNMSMNNSAFGFPFNNTFNNMMNSNAKPQK